MAKRGLGRGLGAFFGDEIANDETPVVKRAPRNTAKKDTEKKKEEGSPAAEQKSSENTAVKTAKHAEDSDIKKDMKEAEPVVVEKIVEVEKLVEVEKVVEKPVEQTLKIALIEPNGEQPRKQFDEEELKELANSIKEYGILQPLLVQKKDGIMKLLPVRDDGELQNLLVLQKYRF